MRQGSPGDVLIGDELDGRVRDDADAVCAVASEHAGDPSICLCHMDQTLQEDPDIKALWRSLAIAIASPSRSTTLACHVLLYIFVFPWTCIRIFKRSSGATAVLDLRWMMKALSNRRIADA